MRNKSEEQILDTLTTRNGSVFQPEIYDKYPMHVIFDFVMSRLHYVHQSILPGMYMLSFKRPGLLEEIQLNQADIFVGDVMKFIIFVFPSVPVYI